MKRRTIEVVCGLVVLVLVTMVASGPSDILKASHVHGAATAPCLNCDDFATPQCKNAGGASSGCESDEIVSECTSDAENNDGVCRDDELDPPSSECHDGCNVDNEYCEDDPSEW